jgi:hypothetical protein
MRDMARDQTLTIENHSVPPNHSLGNKDRRFGSFNFVLFHGAL